MEIRTGLINDVDIAADTKNTIYETASSVKLE